PVADVAQAAQEVFPSFEAAQDADACLRGEAAATGAASRDERRRAPAAGRTAWNRTARPAEHRHRADAQQATQPAENAAASAGTSAAAREGHLLAGEQVHQHRGYA